MNNNPYKLFEFVKSKVPVGCKCQDSEGWWCGYICQSEYDDIKDFCRLFIKEKPLDFKCSECKEMIK